MKVKLRKFDGVYADEREGYKAVSYNIVNDTNGDFIRLGLMFLTLKLDKNKKEVGIEKMLLVPCVLPGTDAYQISCDYGGLGYWFKTDNPKMCGTVDDLRTNIHFIMGFAMKMLSDVQHPSRVAMYIAGALEPNIVDRSTVDKRYFTYEHDFCRYWVPKTLPKKLMKLVEPKSERKVKPDEDCYIEFTCADNSTSQPACNSIGDIPDDLSHPAIGSDDNDNPSGDVM